MQEYFLSNPYFYSLALTLIHFLWQGCIVALALKSALILTSHKNPQLRYAFASMAMLLCLLLPFITFAIIYQPDEVALAQSNKLIPLLATSVSYLPSQSAFWTTNIVGYLPYLSLSWLTIVMLLTFKLFIEVFTVNQLSKQSVMPVDAELLQRFNLLVAKMQLPRLPRLLISLKTDVPMAIGWLKPVILLPASMLSNLTTEQLEMLILHELAHIRRHDYLVNFLQTLVAILLFFHPAVQWISKQMRNEREYCSDDIAVEYCGNAVAYAHTLADTATICSKHRHHTIPNMAMAASGGDLKQRVVRLVDHHCTPSNDVGKWLAASTIVVAIFGFSAQQYLTPGLFEIGTNKHALTEYNDELTHQRNYQESALTKSTIARQLLTSEASFPNNLAEFDIPKPTLVSSKQPANKEVINNKKIIKTQVNTDKVQVAKQSIPVQEVTQPTSETNTAVVAKINTTNTTETTPNISSFDKINEAENNDSLHQVALSTTSINTVKTDNLTLPNKALLTQTSATITESNLAQANTYNQPKIDTLSATSPVVEQNYPKQALAQNDKSPVEIAFENTDSSLQSTSANMANPYASQIAGLNEPAISQRQSQAIAELTAMDDINNQPTNNNLINASLNNTNLNKVDLIQFESNLAHRVPAHGFASLEVNKATLSAEKQIATPSKEKAKLIYGIDPKYPSNAKRKGLELEVQVHFTIDKAGRIKDIEFEQQNKISYFRNAIKTAMRKWSFRPAKVGGQPVESQMSKIFSFSLTS